MGPGMDDLAGDSNLPDDLPTTQPVDRQQHQHGAVSDVDGLAPFGCG